MEFLQLKYFNDAAQTENFSKTAQKFFVPTSAVSQSIRRLEKELGVDLFERRSNRIALNEEGRKFHRAVLQMDSILREAQAQLTRDPAELSGEIRMDILCNRRIVSDAIREFAALHPKVTFLLSHGANSNESYDLVICDDSFSKDRYVRQALITEDIAIAFSKKHPLAGLDKVELPQLAKDHFVAMPPNSRLYDLTQRLCSRAGFAPRVSIRCDDPYYIRKYIEMGLGVGLVPVFSWKGQMSEQMVCKKLQGIRRTTYAYWDGSRPMTGAVQAFLELLTRLCEEQCGKPDE